MASETLTVFGAGLISEVIRYRLCDDVGAFLLVTGEPVRNGFFLWSPIALKQNNLVRKRRTDGVPVAY